MAIRVLVCGSREWTDREIIRAVLAGFDPALVMDGACKTGADPIAHTIAAESEIPTRRFAADWDTHGKAAGPIRNQRMLDEGKPDVVIAFKDGFQRDRPALNSIRPSMIEAKGGTEDMVRRAKAAGIPVYVVSHG